MDAFTAFDVVVNHEEQYSVWPTELAMPAGWTAEGTSGSRQECLDRIEQIWPDIRPRSLRESVALRRAGQEER